MYHTLTAKSKDAPAVLAALCTLIVFAGVVSVLLSHTRHAMNLTSPAFKNNGNIPPLYTCDGENTIPSLEFKDIPVEAKSLALVVEDPDAPSGTFDHWVLFNMPVSIHGVDEGREPEAVRGNNSSGKTGYVGPCPPSGVHHYIFTLYALDTELAAEEGASKKDILEAMGTHIVDRAKLIGLYGRKK